MAQLISPIAALLLSASLFLTGNGLITVLVPLAGEHAGMSAPMLGALGSIYFTGFALGCWKGAVLLKMVGHIRTFTAMTGMAAVVAGGFVLTDSIIAWSVFRLLTGFAFAVLYLVIESWLNERANNENRGTVFGTYTFINLTVVTAGQMMVTLYPVNDPRLFVLYGMLIAGAAVPLTLSRALAPAPIDTVKIRLLHLSRQAPAAAAGGVAVGLANGAFWMMMPRYGTGVGMDVETIALFMAVAVLAGAFGQIPLGKLSDGIDRRYIIILAAVGAVAASLALAVLPVSGGLSFYLKAGAFGVFALPLYALAVAHMNDRVEHGGFVEAAGGMLLLYALGAAVGPLVASMFMAQFGPQMLYGYIAAVYGGLTLWVGLRLFVLNRDAPDMNEQADFVAMPRTSPAAAQLDPRSDEDEVS